MEKCRICLKLRKRMHSLQDSIEGGITYATTIALITNVKISIDDGMPDKVCLICCNRLQDIHELKCLIERSDIELQKKCIKKKIAFTDIQDLKCRIEFTENDSKDAVLHNKIAEQFVQGCDKSLNYNDTVIKRMARLHRNDKKTMSVKEFLQTIKKDPDNEYKIVYDVAVDFEPTESDFGDEEYIPSKKYKKKKIKNADGDRNKISIKPVYLSDIRLARTVPMKKIKMLTCRKHPSNREAMCPHCGKMVKHFKLHELTHIGEKTFKCEKCTKSFYTQTILNAHQKTHENPNFKCDKCVASFSTQGSLNKHQMKHTGQDRNFPCEICGKRFRSKGHVWRHCQGIHNMGTKNFKCEQCSMSFITKSNLSHHIRVHTGERPYKCEICSQPYSYRRDFIRHCKKKHDVFLKGRQINVMNEEVLVQEKTLMRDLMLRVNGITKDDKPLNPYKGPHAVMAFEQAVKALNEQVQIEEF